MSACILQHAEWGDILHSRFRRLWQLSAFCDVALVAGDHVSQMHAHAAFLTAMCNRAFLPMESGNLLSTINVADASKAALQSAITQLYATDDKSKPSDIEQLLFGTKNHVLITTDEYTVISDSTPVVPNTSMATVNAHSSAFHTACLADFSFDKTSGCRAAEQLLIGLDQLRNNKLTCDIELGGHLAHCCVVAAASDSLQKALTSGLVGELEVSDRSWMCILQYIYTSAVQIDGDDSERVVKELMLAAQSVQLEHLATMCEGYLASCAQPIEEDDDDDTLPKATCSDAFYNEVTAHNDLLNNGPISAAADASESVKFDAIRQESMWHIEDQDADVTAAIVVSAPHEANGIIATASESEALAVTGDNQCDSCGKCFSSCHVLRYHKLQSACESTFPCKQCRCRFATPERLEKHMLRHSAPHTFLCSGCDRSFASNASLRQHEIVHSGMRPHICNICSRGFLRKPHLVNHMRTHSHACKQCGLKFSYGAQLTVHRRMVHDLRLCIVCRKPMGDVAGNACDTCISTSKERDNVASKQAMSNTEEKYVCDVCGKYLNRRSDLDRHQQKHIREKLFTCELCDQSFVSLRGLHAHGRQHSSLNGVRAVKLTEECEHCGKRFTRPQDLRRHRRTHTGEKPHTCQVCNRTFSSTSNMAAHIRRHRNDAEYIQRASEKAQKSAAAAAVATTAHRPCDLCELTFEFPDQLLRHQKEHIDKPFFCVVCSKRYTHMTTLRQHIKDKHAHQDGTKARTHPRHYTCEECGKTFCRTTDLRRHRRIHTGEKPFVCDKCGRPFRSAPALTSHKRRGTACT